MIVWVGLGSRDMGLLNPTPSVALVAVDIIMLQYHEHLSWIVRWVHRGGGINKLEHSCAVVGGGQGVLSLF